MFKCQAYNERIGLAVGLKSQYNRSINSWD